VYGSASLYLEDVRGIRFASAARQTAVYTEHGNLRARRGARLLSRWFAGTSFINTRDCLPEGERGQNGADYNHRLAQEGGGSRHVIAGDDNLTIENLVQWASNLPEDKPAVGPSEPSVAESHRGLRRKDLPIQKALTLINTTIYSAWPYNLIR